MKLSIVVWTLLVLNGASGAMRPNENPYMPPNNTPDPGRRQRALEEKAEKNAVNNRLKTLTQQNSELEKQVTQLKQEAGTKDLEINNLKQQIAALAEHIRFMEATSNTIVYTKPCFDVYLGERAEYVEARLGRGEGVPISGLLLQGGKSHPIKPKCDEVAQLTVYSYNNQVFQVIALYKDASEDNYKKVKEQLAKTFLATDITKKPNNLPGTDFYTATLDGILVLAAVDRLTGRGNDCLKVTFAHAMLNEAAAAKKDFFIPGTAKN